MELNDIKVNALVEHPALGLGRVIAIQGTNVHVYFHKSGGRCATKLAASAVAKFLRPAGVASHVWLDHLPRFDYDEKQVKFCLEHDRLTHEQAVAKFMATFPGGFNDTRYLGTLKEGERVYKDRMAALSRDLVRDGADLLAHGDSKGFRDRLVEVSKVNLLNPKWTQPALRDAVADAPAATPFFEAILRAASEAPSEAAFSAVAEALDRLPANGSPVATWPVATFFPFLARPTEHMFLRPSPTREAAKRLHFELNYSAQPNWRTYSSLLAFAAELLEELRRYGAKDYIDVQSFIFVTWIPDYTTAEEGQDDATSA